MHAMTLTSNLKRVIETSFPEIDIVFAYGSAVFHQRNHDPRGSMIDFIFAVKDPFAWHQENLARNSHHYSFLKHFGARTIANIQCRYGARVYYNTLVDVDLHEYGGSSFAIKYGVVSCADLCQDLEHWSHLYISGRMHKPVQLLSCAFDPFHSASARNLENALHYALICLPGKFSERELLMRIAGISYSGDFRMKFGENPKKVQNIVDGNYSDMISLYSKAIKNCQFIHRSNQNSQQLLSSIQTDGAQLFQSLPSNVHAQMQLYNNRFPLNPHMQQEMLRKRVKSAVRSIVRSSSRSQSIKGMFTAGAWKTASYILKKLNRTYKKTV